jgi:hypothetical protein
LDSSSKLEFFSVIIDNKRRHKWKLKIRPLLLRALEVV